MRQIFRCYLNFMFYYTFEAWHKSVCYLTLQFQPHRKPNQFVMLAGGKRWSSWLRHCATCRQVAGSIPVVVIVIFHRPNHSARTTALKFELASKRNEYQRQVKGGWRVRLIILLTFVSKSGSLNFMELPVSVIGLYRDCFTFTFTNEMQLLWIILILIFCPLCVSTRGFIFRKTVVRTVMV